MNILIENDETLEYLTNDGLWTKTAAHARHFGATVNAVEVAKKEQIRKFNIVCYIPETKQFVNLDHGRGKAGAIAVAQ